MDAATKKQIIEEYATKPGDTGSPDVQIAVLSKRIAHLTEHLKEHKGDHHSRRGLMLMVGQRRRLLNYVAKQDVEHYRSLIARLGLRRCRTLLDTVRGGPNGHPLGGVPHHESRTGTQPASAPSPLKRH